MKGILGFAFVHVTGIMTGIVIGSVVGFVCGAGLMVTGTPKEKSTEYSKYSRPYSAYTKRVEEEDK
jgi:hypothetical protein